MFEVIIAGGAGLSLLAICVQETMDSIVDRRRLAATLAPVRVVRKISTPVSEPVPYQLPKAA